MLWDPFVAVRPGRGPGVAPHVRAHVVVPGDLQHGRQPRAALRARRGAPAPRPLVRAVPRRPRRGVAHPPARTHPRAARPGARRRRAHPSGDIEEYRALLAEPRRRPPRRARRPGQPARQAAARRRRDGAAARRPGRGAQAGARALGQPGAGAHPAAHDGALDARRLPRADPPARDRRAAPAVRAAQPELPARGRRAAAPPARHGDASDDDADARVDELQARRARAPAARRGRHRGRAARRVAGRPHRPRGRAPRAPHRGPHRDPRPPVRPGARRARVVGLRRRLGAAAERPAALPAQHRVRPRGGRGAAHRPPRRPRRRRALAAIVSCFVYQRRGPDSDDPMPPAPLAGARSSASGSATIERIWKDLEPHRARPAAAARPAGPIPGSPPRSTRGPRATTSPTSSRTRR